jgi:hypothetical protein
LILSDFCLEAFTLTIAQVHTQKDLCPILGLCAAGTGIDADNSVAGIVFTGKHTGKFHLPDRLFQHGQHLANFRQRLRVLTLLAKFDQNLDILETTINKFPVGNKFLQESSFLQNFLGLFIIIPELRPGYLGFEF